MFSNFSGNGKCWNVCPTFQWRPVLSGMTTTNLQRSAAIFFNLDWLGHKAVWEGLCPSSRVPYRNKKLHFTIVLFPFFTLCLWKFYFTYCRLFLTLIQEGDAIIYSVLRSRECWVLHRINFVTDTVTDESNYILNTPLLILKGTYGYP